LGLNLFGIHLNQHLIDHQNVNSQYSLTWTLQLIDLNVDKRDENYHHVNDYIDDIKLRLTKKTKNSNNY
jgi:hypothetical protein